MNSLSGFKTKSFITALKAFFIELKVPVNYITDQPAMPRDILGEFFKKDNFTHQLIDDVYVVGLVDDSAFSEVVKEKKWTTDRVKKIDKVYDGLLIIGVTMKSQAYTRSQLAEIARLFNRAFPNTPVTIIFKYGDLISFANTERVKYKQEWREGEKVGKVTMLKDIDIEKTHAAHLKILAGLTIHQSVDSFAKLYKYWQSQFSLQALNDQFYKDLQEWFYFAIKNIRLPYKPDYIEDKENIKNFLVRLLARTMFCWFVKEKGVIRPELLEITDWEGNKYPLTKDINDQDFLNHNSYYRGVLQNMFFNALNQKDKKSIKDFKWTKYLHPDFQITWFTNIPYLNGGIFDKLELEDNAKESIEDTVITIPNFLFYGIENEETIKKGKGVKAKTVIEKVVHKGLNGILKSYKFTLDENTPFEEDIALDPEMLGLVFENLLAELDPNLEESTVESIRKLTGSYYTPRKVIFEMVNDSLYLYLVKFVQNNYPQLSGVKEAVKELVYSNYVNVADKTFCQAIVKGLDKFKMLDPACGSGAFPLGMLHRMVDLLKLVDGDNQLWLDLKVNGVDLAQRAEFRKILNQHLDDYGRKLGVIRDSIYGIDIQPLAVQITKLRFFISLLIDQNVEKGITPMPNIETKIICADSLRNIKADFFSVDAIDKLSEARTRYYQPDISHEEREQIANEIVGILDLAFPFFSFQITGKHSPGQNIALLKEWFKHSTIAAPFFNMDFFYPELKPVGGFDCVIGNPPYGGTKISDEIQKALVIESKDPYGAFIARFLNATQMPTPLKHGGVLAFIVSDTFMTIKSHLILRKYLMQNYIHKMIRVAPDTFRATVNTVIMIAERNTQWPFEDNHICLMADMTNISIHDNYDHFIEVLSQTKGVDFESSDAHQCFSSEEYAIYYYPQSLIRSNSNLPFFVASPKLFALMNDGNDLKRKFLTEIQNISGKNVHVRTVNLNGKEIQVVKLGEIAEIKVGLQTGDNKAYLFQSPEVRGSYRSIVDFKRFLLSEEDLEKIRKNDALRLSIINEGISRDDLQSDRYFDGKYIIPYDKGGESDAEDGWMPNYYVPTNYFIDWSEWAVNRMKTLTTKERNNSEGKEGGDNKICSRFQNSENYFLTAISFSRTGIYSPTFRIGSSSPFDTEGSMIFQDYLSDSNLSGVLSSKLIRFFCKNFIGHTIHSQIDELKELIISFKADSKTIESNVFSIIKSQRSNLHYDYASREQIEIDKLVYEAYGLIAEDVVEVENWYVRRYPRLSAAQKANLSALGKSDDYLELYGLK